MSISRPLPVDRLAIEVVLRAAGAAAQDPLGVRLVAEQRLVVLGVPVVPAGIIGALTSGDRRVVVRTVRQTTVIEREVGRARRDRMLALRTPPAAAAAHGLNRDGIRIAAAPCRPQPPSIKQLLIIPTRLSHPS